MSYEDQSAQIETSASASDESINAFDTQSVNENELQLARDRLISGLDFSDEPRLITKEEISNAPNWIASCLVP